MDEFCGTSFWNNSITWQTTDPFFTHCFEETVLIWIPSFFIVCFFLIDLYFSLKSKTSNNKNLTFWNPFTVVKCGVTLTLIVISFIQLSKIQFYNDTRFMDHLGPALRLVSYFLALGLTLLSRANRVCSSGVQLYFWLCCTICEGILFRTAVRRYDAAVDVDTLPNFVYLMRFFTFPMVTVQLLLNCWADGGIKEKRGALVGNPCPEKNSSHLCKLLYSWYDAMAWKGFRQPLRFDDLWDLNEEDKAEVQIPKFYEAWKAAESKKNKKNFAKTLPTQQEEATEGFGVMSILTSCYGSTVVVAGIMKLIQDLLAFVSPQILKMLITHVSPSSTEPVWKGYFYAGVLLVTAIIQTLFGIQHNKNMLLVGMRVRSVLSSAVYRKYLVVSNAGKKDTTTGEIVNLMSVDTQRLMDLCPMLHTAWTSFIVISLSVYFLYNTLGAAVFAGLGVMILLVPVNGVAMGKLRQLQMQQMILKDKRVKLMSEVLNGMKVLKLFGWEPCFESQIAEIRAKEMVLLRKAAILSSSFIFFLTSAPFLVALATLGTYVLTGENHNLTAERTFVALSLLAIIRIPMTFLPTSIAFMVQAGVSVNRFNKYFSLEEIDTSAITRDKISEIIDESPLSVKNGTFSWTDESITLKDIDFSVKKGSLTAVVGSVGSGKTSLLSALLGNLKKHSGSINVNGSIAFVAQTAWIQNATLKNNILFNNDLHDGSLYRKVVEACALGPDLAILGSGDETEIGEKGINLSGGQKQRVALARAAYKESDIYLWDDPLSAVDSHVAKHIFDHLIGPHGLLSDKTRILVTHGIAFLPQVDNIVVMKDGKISEVGTFIDLLAKKGSFAEVLSQHLSLDGNEEVNAALIAKTSTMIIESSEKSTALESLEGMEKKAGQHETGIKSKTDKLIQDEKSETGHVKWSVFADYVQACGLGISLLFLTFLIVSTGIVTFSNIWLSDWSQQATKDEIIHNGTQNKDTTNKYLGGYGALGASQVVSYLVAILSFAIGSMNAAGRLHSIMLARVMRAPMAFFETTPLGRLVNRFAKDVDTSDTLVPLNMRATINIVLNLISAIVVLAYCTPTILFAILPCLVLYFWLQRIYVATSLQLRRIESVTRSPIYSKFEETISGATTIRAFQLEKEFVAEADKKINENQQAYYPFIASTLWMSVRLEFIGGLILFASAVFAVMARDSINPSIVGLSITSAITITQLLSTLVRMSSELESNIVSVERMKELTTETPQEADWILDKRPPKEWPQAGAVTFKNYETRYRPGLDLALKGITCSFKPGEKIGIVGRTAAGKSSLALALFRILEPASGSIHIDGIDVTEVGLHDLRSKITIIPQDPVLFSGNLRINLDPFHAHSDDEVWSCLELSHLKTFVSSLPAGLEYEVETGGQNFSVGQRQLVCLARALLRKNKILMLDEATAAVDLETDDLIKRTIISEFAESTVITIAHRLNTIMDSDRVAVLDKGTIVEFDSPGSLLENKNSIFFAMAKDAGVV